VAPNFEYLQSVLNPAGSPIVPIAPEDCYLLYVDPADGLIKPTIKPWPEGLDEDNVSYRFGLSYTLAGGAMAYANYSRGWKAGLISNVSGSTLAAITPAPQERLDAWEAGVKVPLANRAVQWNLAAFYYDYRHKQIRGRISDPIFGLLESLVSIPKSEVYGFETEIVARPIAGLSLSGGLTYLHSQITAPFNSFNQSGAAFDFEGAHIPYTPEWQGVADAQYEWDMGGVRPFLGGSLTYHSADNATFTVPAAPAPDFAIDPYTLIDLRAGVSAPDDSWRIMLFGRNVTNAYYVTTGFNGSDTRYRLSGRPATWGIQLRVKTN
jgi:iron complex outermembrane receptor protein